MRLSKNVRKGITFWSEINVPIYSSLKNPSFFLPFSFLYFSVLHYSPFFFHLHVHSFASEQVKEENDRGNDRGKGWKVQQYIFTHCLGACKNKGVVSVNICQYLINRRITIVFYKYHICILTFLKTPVLYFNPLTF